MEFKNVSFCILIFFCAPVELICGAKANNTDPTEALDHFIKCWNLLFIEEPVLPGQNADKRHAELLESSADYVKALKEFSAAERKINSALDDIKSAGKFIDDDLIKIVKKHKFDQMEKYSTLLAPSMGKMERVKQGRLEEAAASKRTLDSISKHPYCYTSDFDVSNYITAIKSIGVDLHVVEKDGTIANEEGKLPKQYPTDMLKLLKKLTTVINDPKKVKQIYAEHKPLLGQLLELMRRKQDNFERQIFEKEEVKSDIILDNILATFLEMSSSVDNFKKEFYSFKEKFIATVGFESRAIRELEDLEVLYEQVWMLFDLGFVTGVADGLKQKEKLEL